MELAISELREGVLLETLGNFALALNYELVILHGHAHILLGDSWEDDAHVQIIVIPAGLNNGAESPAPFAARVRRRRDRLAIEIVKHLVDRTAELIQRLSNIVRY